MTDDAKAWGDFWANNTASGAGGCLPERWAAIETAQEQAWLGFIAELPEAASVLDLATGDGRVLRWMQAARGDLALTGIDLAPTLPPAPAGTQTRGGVPMEALPFEAASFGAVVSQFGFEYGDVTKVAKEIARVLTPGGRAGLMVHRGDGPILAHNLARKGEIEWILGEADAIGAVTRALEAPGAGPAVAAQVAAVLARLGSGRFGETSPAWEIPEALRRACLMGQDAGVGSIGEVISAIGAQAGNEMGRIDSLARACAAADDRTALVSAFDALGFAHISTVPVSEASGRAIADFLVFHLKH